jgi:hypothetical protein
MGSHMFNKLTVGCRFTTYSLIFTILCSPLHMAHGGQEKTQGLSPNCAAWLTLTSKGPSDRRSNEIRIEHFPDEDPDISVQWKTMPASLILKEKGIVHLTHWTRTENLPALIRNGALVSIDNLPEGIKPHYGYAKGVIFFNLKSINDLPQADKIMPFCVGGYFTGHVESSYGDLNRIHLIFDTQVLDGAKYHISSHGYDYGKFDTQEDFISTMGPKMLEQFLDWMTHSPGEVVVYDKVTTSKLKAIWVHPAIRNDVLKLLRENNINEINGQSIELVVISPETNLVFHKKGNNWYFGPEPETKNRLQPVPSAKPRNLWQRLFGQ